MPGLVKIGHTSNGLAERLVQLSAATGVPVPFAVEAWFACSPHLARRYEKQAHAALATKRVPAREFFEVEVTQAVAVVGQIIGRAPEIRA
jgi:hypothetical protein